MPTPITPAGREGLAARIRFRKTCKTERAAQIELGKLLAMAQARRHPDSDATVAQLGHRRHRIDLTGHDRWPGRRAAC